MDTGRRRSCTFGGRRQGAAPVTIGDAGCRAAHGSGSACPTVDVDDRIVAGVAALVERGYVIALDDFVTGSGHERLFDLATYIKVDFLGTTPAQRQAILDVRTTHPHLRFVAVLTRQLAALAWATKTAQAIRSN